MMLTVQTVIRDYFTDETGRKLISADKLYRMARKKEIPALRLEGRWYFSKEALDRWKRCDDFFQGKVAAKHRPVMDPIPE